MRFFSLNLLLSLRVFLEFIQFGRMRNMKLKIETDFQNYISAWNQHVGLVEQAWLDNQLDHHQGKPGKSLPPLRLSPSIQFTHFPLVWCGLYGLRAFMYILAVTNFFEHGSWWEQFFLRAGEKYTRSSSLNSQVCVVIWTVNYLLVTIKDYGMTLDKLKFLIVYSVGRRGARVQPKDLALSKAKFMVFARFRMVLRRMLNLSNKSVVSVVALVEPALSLQTNQFTKYPFYTVASVLGIIYWAIHACQGKST